MRMSAHFTAKPVEDFHVEANITVVLHCNCRAGFPASLNRFGAARVCTANRKRLSTNEA